MSRRQVLAGAGGTGLLAAASPARAAARTRRARAGTGAADGTPEQIHLTWGENPATGVVVSWASPGQAGRPRVQIGQRIITAEPRPYTDGINGDLCYADLNPTVQPEVWRDFGNNNQTSAASRPWMPCPGHHEVEFETFRLVRPRLSVGTDPAEPSISQDTVSSWTFS